jgi:two-component system chemotaxis family response regulator WspR
VLASQTAELAKTRRELSEHARVDTLTGLRNSVRLQEDLRAFRGRAARYGHRYAIAVCDLDQYAAYNERYGRPAGDEVVRAIGHVFSDECRTGDEIYRDGAQFLLVLPEQSVPQATGVVERIRCRIQGLQLEHSSNQPADVVTVSVGVAMLDPESRADERSILGPAQAYLSMAKERGRNRVVASESTLT